jgi:T5SS/PEP-CTERM-associated repeat protein
VESNGSAYLGHQTLSTGAAYVTGPNSTWQMSEVNVGNGGVGTLLVDDGAELRTGTSFIGRSKGSVGLAKVHGAGTAWRDSSSLYVGAGGYGELHVEAGAYVETSNGTLGAATGSIGKVVVTGPGSMWTDRFNPGLSVGASGVGTLIVSDGGQVSAASLTVNSVSTVRLHVTGDNMLLSPVGNSGTVAFLADALLPAGVYRPLSGSLTLSGSGTHTAVGGTWNNTDRTFTVPAATLLADGASDAVSTGERLLFTDPVSSKKVGASFGAITGTPTFSATQTRGAPLSALWLQLDAGEQVLAAWDFTTNFGGGSEVLLSFDIGLGAEDLELWHFQSGAWSAYTPAMLTYDANGRVSLTANSFSGYAVTGLMDTPLVASFWNVDADGNWSDDINWRNAEIPNGVGHIAHFTTFPVTTTAPRTVTVDAPKTVGQIVFAGSEPYALAGAHAITLDANSGQAVVEVQSGNHVISAPVTLNDDLTFNVASQSGLTLSGNLTATGSNVTKDGLGSVQLENVRAASLAVNQGIVSVRVKPTANDPAGTSVVQSLSISAGAKLYLDNNSMIIDYTGSVGSLVDDVRQHLLAGRLIGNAALGSGNASLGYADNAALDSIKTSFAGQSVDPSSLLIKFTYAGDADLDGDVDVADLGKLATSWQGAAPWTGGDFDYNGTVEVNDLGMLASNWQAGVGSPLGPSLQEALSALGLPASVPEPGGAMLVFVGLTSFSAGLRWRRRGLP